MSVFATASVSASGSSTASNPIPLDWKQTSFFVAVRVVPVNAGGTFAVQYTLDNVLNGDTPTWVTADSSTGLDSVNTNAEISSLVAPVTALRLICSSTATVASAAATITVVQGMEN